MMELTINQQIDECAKVWRSFLYFLDAWVWIEDKEHKRQIKLKLWPAQAKVIPQLLNSLLSILIKARQLGLTWLVAALSLWLSMRHPLHLIVVISATEDHAIEFLDRVYFIMDRLPDWMLPKVKVRNKQILTFSHKAGTEATIKSLPTTEMGAESKTPNMLVIDEAHMIRGVETIYTSSLPGIEQAGGQIIVIANSVKNRPGWPWVRDTYIAARKKENDFNRIFLPYQAHPGRPADFKARMLRSGMTPEDFSEHYPETETEALSSSFAGFFGQALVRHQSTRKGVTGNLVEDPHTKEISFEPSDHGILEVWRWPYYLLDTHDGLKWSDRYAVGGDVSEGLGASYSVAYVVDRLHDEIVARMRSNRIDAYKWGDLTDLLSRWYDRALTCVEVTGAGQTTVKRLVELKANQYVKVTCDKTGKVVTSQIGWPENEKNKYECCGDLRQWLVAMKGTLYDGVLLDECATFIKYEGSRRIGPEMGKLADCVMAASMAREADLFIAVSPKKAERPLTGWRKRQQDISEEGRVWAA